MIIKHEPPFLGENIALEGGVNMETDMADTTQTNGATRETIATVAKGLREKGKTLKEIASALNGMGYKTANGFKFTNQTVRILMRGKSYTVTKRRAVAKKVSTPTNKPLEFFTFITKTALNDRTTDNAHKLGVIKMALYAVENGMIQ